MHSRDNRRRSSTRRGTALAVVVATAALAAGLESGAAAQGPEGAEDSQPAPEQRALRIPIPAYDGTLTPYTFELAYQLLTLVYDTLYWRDADGVPQPWLAESLERSEDGRTITIQLREGARWHDGRPVTAADVAFSFDYYRARFHPRFTPQLAAVESARATGPGTVEIALRHPAPGFEDQPLSDVPILPEHLWGNLPAGQAAPSGTPVGSGPYEVVSQSEQDGYRMRANPRYFLRSPAVPGLEFPVFRTVDETLSELRRRRVGMLPVSLPPDLLDRVSGLGITAAGGPLYSGVALVMNTGRPPFDQPQLRKAVAQSLDLTRIARSVGGVTPAADGYLHPESRWAPGEQLQQTDVAAAQEAIGRLEGPPIEILVPEADPARAEAGRQVALALIRAGARTKLKEVSFADLDEAVGVDNASPSFDAAILPTPALASYDPDFLTTVFGSGSDAAPLNFSNFSSAGFDALAAEVAAETDPEKREELVGEELRLIADQAPAVPLYFDDAALPYRPSIYDRWTFVNGTGILDKQSFLPGDSETEEADSGIDTGAGESSGIGVLGWAAIALFVLAAGLGAASLLRARTR